MAALCMRLLFSAAFLLASAPPLFCSGDTLIDVTNSLHPFDISVQLPPSSQLLFYSISLASALLPAELAADAIRRSVAHPAVSAPVVLCSSSIPDSSNSSNITYDASSAALTSCLFSSNLTAQLESLLLRQPAPSGILLAPPSLTACIQAFSAVGNFSFNAQLCSGISCALELASFIMNHNITATSTVACQPLVISLPPILLAASFGLQTVVMPSLVPTGSPSSLLNATFTAAAAAGADLKLLILVSSLASDISIAPVNQPPPPCRYSSSLAFASHSDIIVANSSTWTSPHTSSSPRPSSQLYQASSPFAALLLSSPLVARLAVATFTIKPCLFAPLNNQPFCVVPSVIQRAAPAAVQRDTRFAYAFSNISDQSLMTISTPFICASYTLPLPQPRWLAVGPDVFRSQTSAVGVFLPTLFPTALQSRAAAAVAAAAAADAVAFSAQLECEVWRMLLSQSSSDSSSNSESPCPHVPPSMLPGLQVVYTAAECRVRIPFNATSNTSGFNASISFMQSPSAERFSFLTLSGAAHDNDTSQYTATGERIEVQAEATFSFRDVGAVIPLCAVLWTASAPLSVNASDFNAAMTRTHCVLVLVQPCFVCGHRSIAYTASTMAPRSPTQLLMALNLNTVRSLPPPPSGFTLSPSVFSRPHMASLLLPELKRIPAFDMPEGHMLQTGLVHTIVDGDSLASVATQFEVSLNLLALANPGLPVNASEAAAGGGDYALMEGAFLCVRPVMSSGNDAM